MRISIRESPNELTSPEPQNDNYNKKPSYLGVSCSNSGYRNVINYDSKLRENFRSSSHHRESLVLSNSRLRENSPLKFEYDIKSFNGNISKDDNKLNSKSNLIEKAHVNGVNQLNLTNEKFLNISTSTKTISTFRTNEDDTKQDNNVEYKQRNDKVSLNQILNNKVDENHKRYSSLGLTPKNFKSPEKNCNSFLRSINSFENNCKVETEVKSNYSVTTRRVNSNYEVFESKNSIQQRIERLYGPAALAQGFYVQKPAKSKSELRCDESSSLK